MRKTVCRSLTAGMGALLVCGLAGVAAGAPLHDVLVYGWDGAANWYYAVDHAQGAPYAGAASDTYAGSTWQVTWDIDASQGSVRARQEVDRPAGSTYYSICESCIYLTDTFHVDAGTSGLAPGTPVTVHLTGTFAGTTWCYAPWATNGSTNAALYVGYVGGPEPGSWASKYYQYISQGCYDAGSPGVKPVSFAFDIPISTTVGAAETYMMGVGPLGRYCNPGTQTTGCEVQDLPGTVGFDVTGQWTLNSAVAGLEMSTEGGLPIPEPATLALLALGGAGVLLRRKKQPEGHLSV